MVFPVLGRSEGGIFMKAVTVYYDDQKESCRKYAEIFEGYDQVICKKLSAYDAGNIVFESNEWVGFLFESDGEQVPYKMNRLFQKIVMSKKGCYFVHVTGGRRELTAARMAYHELESRGYRNANIYSQYYFEKYHLDEQQAVCQMLESIEQEHGMTSEEEEFKKQKPEMTARQIRKSLRRDLKKYK